MAHVAFPEVARQSAEANAAIRHASQAPAGRCGGSDDPSGPDRSRADHVGAVRAAKPVGLGRRQVDPRLRDASNADRECKEYVPAVRAMLANEIISENRTLVEPYLSMLEKGYWLDTKEEYGGFWYEVADKSGFTSARIPKKAFASLSEQEVMKRVREAHEDWRSGSAKWLDEINRP